MLDPLFGFQFIQTTTRSPEQMPRDRDMRREEQESEAPAANRGPCCSSRRKVGSWNWICSEKCQMPGTPSRESPHSNNPWRCGSPPAEGNAGKIAWEGAEYSMEPKSAWEHPQHRGLWALLLLRAFSPRPISCPRVFYREKNIPAALQIWDPVLFINGINVISIAPGSWSTEPEKLGC